MPSAGRGQAAASGGQRLRALAELSRLVSASLEPGAVLDAAVAAAARLLAVEDVRLWLHDPEADVLRPAAQAPAGSVAPDVAVPVDASIAGSVLRSGRPFVTDQVTTHPLWRALVAWGEQPASALFVPFSHQERPLGVLVAVSARERAFDDEDVELAEALAAQVAVAIHNARLHGAAVRRGEQLTALLRATRTLMSGLELEGTLSRICQEACEIAGTSHVKILLVDEERQVLRPAAVRGGPVPDGFEVPLGTSYSGVVATSGQPLFVDDTQGDDARNLLAQRDREHGIRTYLGLPIKAGDTVIGVLTFNTTEPHQYSPDELAYLGSFADHAAIAIENARLYEQAATIEALRELARLKSEFLSTVSHELRTPLSLIHGYAELLMHRAAQLAPEHVAQMAREIQAGSRTMVRLVDDLLDFSRIEQGRLTLDRRRVALEAVLGPLIETFRRRPDGGRIVPEIADGVVTHVDPERLAQAVSHLLGNALRYAPDGPVVVRAAARDGELRVEVTDRGPGLAVEEQPRVWERFYRGSASLGSADRGSGLGLAVVRHLVELHGGWVGLTSDLGRGATFWFVVPTDPADAAPPGAAGAAPGA